MVYELIRNDLFNYENNEYKLLIDLLSIENDKLQTALISIISVVASTLKGVDYLTQDGENTILRILLKVYTIFPEIPPITARVEIEEVAR